MHDSRSAVKVPG